MAALRVPPCCSNGVRSLEPYRCCAAVLPQWKRPRWLSRMCCARSVRAQPVQPATMRTVPAFQWSDLFGWKGYAAAAAVVAICLGLGLWFAQRSEKTSQQPTARTEQPAQPSVGKAGETPQLPVQASTSNSNKLNSATNSAVTPRASVTTASLTQSEQAQGYTPLMLCDPISCSGDAEVVRMELPATGVDGSSGSQMADVIVGDDGLVRAIRIVQQQ